MWDQDLFQKTIKFAGTVHVDQFLPGSKLPYVIHLVTVCTEVLNAIGENHQNEFDINFAMQCALLHDTLEDTEATFEEIEKEFGRKVAEGVDALTKKEDLAKEVRMKDSLDRILKQPSEIRLVKIADRITNLQIPPSHWDREKIRFYHQEAILIYETLQGTHQILEKRFKEKIIHYKERYLM